MKINISMKNSFKFSILVLAFCSFVFNESVSKGGRLAMKVVESPVAYGFNNDLISPTNNQESLILQIQPQNVSGPEQLHQLLGRCYNFSDDLYHYAFCPFQNITQYEISNRWNAYQGVLGVWQEWKIINNTFHSMMMLHGDSCGSIQRSTEVVMECGNIEQIKDVHEPTKCQYKMVFQTQLVCHPDALLVYPWLSPNLQKKWNQLETDLINDDITYKGYTNGLRELFLEAKFIIAETSAVKTNLHSNIDVSKTDKSLTHSQCLQEVADLRREIEALKLLLELNAITDKKGNT